MDLAYVDKLAKKNNRVKYLLVRQDLLDRTVNAKGMKTKDSPENVQAFSSMITKKHRPKKIWADKGTRCAGAFENFCAAEGIQVYSTMSETRYGLLFRKGYNPQFTRKSSENVANATIKPPAYTIKDEENEIIQGKFYQKKLIKVI